MVSLKNEPQKTFDVFCQGITLDTLYLGSVTNPVNDTVDVAFSIPVKIKKSILGKVICPKCNHSNSVL